MSALKITDYEFVPVRVIFYYAHFQVSVIVVEEDEKKSVTEL
jgi:hypothetical protein